MAFKFTIRQLIRISVHSCVTKHAITPFVSTASPEPTRICLVDLAPKHCGLAVGPAFCATESPAARLPAPNEKRWRDKKCRLAHFADSFDASPLGLSSTRHATKRAPSFFVLASPRNETLAASGACLSDFCSVIHDVIIQRHMEKINWRTRPDADLTNNFKTVKE